MNLGGRPREHDRDQIGLDIIEWAKKEDSINLNGFCCDYDIEPSMLGRWAKEEDGFRRSYEKAKAYLGKRREKLLTENKLHVKAYDLNASTYDYFLKEEKRDQARFEAELAKQAESANEKDKENLTLAINTVNFLQESARKIDDNSNNAEAKS